MGVSLSQPQSGSGSRLLTVDDAKSLDVATMADLFKQHMNPGQYHFMKLLGFHKVKVERAEGMYYIDQNGRQILDFFGGFGSVAFGHNHPRIVAARKRFQDEQRHDIAMAFLSQYAAALSHNLAALSADNLDMVFLGSTGSEAVEAAIKLAERCAGSKRSKIAYAENAFHGKSKGALTVTDSDMYRDDFVLPFNAVKVPFGDLDSLELLLRSDTSIGVLILETIQGGAGINTAPASYWQGVRALCDKHNVVWIADEVQCGMGRTGKFYAVDHAGVVPDITVMAKALGGGKCAMAAFVVRRELYMKAYGKPKNALIHGPATFGGMGEACVTAIEALNVLNDERLMDNADRVGTYLMDELRRLQVKYPKIIKEVRGQGLMVGLEFQDFSQTMPAGVRMAMSVLDDKLKGSLSGFVGSILLRDHDVLVAFTEYNRNVIRLEPPLICEPAHVDAFIRAMDEVLGRGVVSIVKDFIGSQLS